MLTDLLNEKLPQISTNTSCLRFLKLTTFLISMELVTHFCSVGTAKTNKIFWLPPGWGWKFKLDVPYGELTRSSGKMDVGNMKVITVKKEDYLLNKVCNMAIWLIYVYINLITLIMFYKQRCKKEISPSFSKFHSRCLIWL